MNLIIFQDGGSVFFKFCSCMIPLMQKHFRTLLIRNSRRRYGLRFGYRTKNNVSLWWIEIYNCNPENILYQTTQTRSDRQWQRLTNVFIAIPKFVVHFLNKPLYVIHNWFSDKLNLNVYGIRNISFIYYLCAKITSLKHWHNNNCFRPM